jgi:hypothetical protein
MRTRFVVALAVAAGVGIGAVAVEGLHAQAKPPAYAVVEIDVTDQDSFLKEYSPTAGKALTEGGGQVSGTRWQERGD